MAAGFQTNSFVVDTLIQAPVVWKFFRSSVELIRLIILYKNRDVNSTQVSYVLSLQWKLEFAVRRQTAHGDGFQCEVKANFCAEDLKINGHRL